MPNIRIFLLAILGTVLPYTVFAASYPYFDYRMPHEAACDMLVADLEERRTNAATYAQADADLKENCDWNLWAIENNMLEDSSDLMAAQRCEMIRDYYADGMFSVHLLNWDTAAALVELGICPHIFVSGRLDYCNYEFIFDEVSGTVGAITGGWKEGYLIDRERRGSNYTNSCKDVEMYDCYCDTGYTSVIYNPNSLDCFCQPNTCPVGYYGYDNGCLPCPVQDDVNGTSNNGTVPITDCYLPGGSNFTDDKGQFTLTDSCYYTE